MLGGGCHPGLVYAEDRCKTGVQSRKIDQESTKNPEHEKADCWTVKPGIPKHGKRGVENHAKGGYHAPLSNAVYP